MRRLRVRYSEALAGRPRYLAFTATALARHGLQFEQIAGNRGAILVSRVVPVPGSVPPPATSSSAHRS